MPITPSSANLDGKQIQQLNRSPAAVWVSNVGNLYTDIGATVPYTGVSTTQVYLKAQNKTSTGTVTAGGDTCNVTITGVLPLNPNYAFEIDPDKRGVLTNVKRDGSVNGRILGTGTLMRDYKLPFRNRKQSEYVEMETFWDDHYPHLTFKYIDLWRNITGTFRFDSKIKATPASFNDVSMEVAIAQVG